MKRILIFPHMSLFYGNLFNKDYIIPKLDNAEIIFMEIERLPSFSDKNNSSNLYKYKTVREEFKKINKFKVLSILLSTFNEFLKMIPRISMRLWYMVFIFKLKVNIASLILEKLNIDLVVIGYDILFPIYLSDALENLRIPTISILERPIHCMTEIYSIRADYYFIGGQKECAYLQKNPINKIKFFFPIGLIRTDLISMKIDIQSNLVIVFDFHSADIPLVGLNSWKNNLLFYEEILYLSKIFKKYKFIIRGKNLNWTSIPYFKNIYEKIKYQNNIEINTESSLNASYTLLMKSNFVIARHTSIGDEAIAAGKKVIFLDYYHGGSYHIKNIFNYENMAYIAQDRISLKESFKKMISGKDNFLKSKREDFFGKVDGHCHLRYSQHVKELLA
jgi:hypothetical protein